MGKGRYLLSVMIVYDGYDVYDGKIGVFNFINR